ncbi:glycosyl transferase [Siculibacillus lacustris]|uniref:Glycosyl transferase n=1 Tax=Siculibacillus lacustris TaxID=1549641 RepID=A0A4Q9VPK0_9HYPH|nr:glycosyl transferase [Siculibacillus lacustris]TBW37661.1 glycosyl transferase [Siculibacillus lacustris]
MSAANLSPVNVVCIKWGDKYPVDYVNRLFRGVSRHLARPFRFLCFTERPEGLVPGIEVHPLPVEPFEAAMVAAMNAEGRKGAWRKVSLFRPGLADMTGPVLGFDIDVVVTGPLDDLLDFAPGKVAMRREWRYERRGKDGGHGSVFLFDPARHAYLYDEFAADPEGSVARHKGSEQYYTSMTALRHGDLAYWPGPWIASFKRDAMRWPPVNLVLEPKLPEDARVVCFHGTPKMEEAVEGWRGSLWRSTRASTWLRDLWIGEDGAKVEEREP